MTDTVPSPKVAKTAKPKAKSTHNYVALISQAITELKERGGSSLQAIKKFVESKGLSKGLGEKNIWEKRLSQSVKAMVKSGKLTQVKASFKLGDKLKAKAKKPAAKKPAVPKKPTTDTKVTKTAKPKTAKPKTAAKPKSTAAAKPKTSKATKKPEGVKKVKAPKASEPKAPKTAKPKTASKPKAPKAAKPKTASKPKAVKPKSTKKATKA